MLCPMSSYIHSSHDFLRISYVSFFPVHHVLMTFLLVIRISKALVLNIVAFRILGQLGI